MAPGYRCAPKDRTKRTDRTRRTASHSKVLMRTGSIIALAALIYVAFVGPLHSSAGVTENSAAAVAQADSASLNASTDKTLSSKPQAGQRHAFAFPLSNRFEPLLLLLLGSVLLGVGTSVRVAARRV